MKKFYLMRLVLSLLAGLSLGTGVVSAAPFTPGNIVIARVGDGSATLNTAAAAVFLDEYTPAGGLVQSLPMPTAVSGNNRSFTVSGNATSELQLARTADGRSLVLAGYGTTPGTASVSTSAATDVVRVVGLVGANGSIDTGTSLGAAFGGTNVRAVASADGTGFYVVGNSSTTSPTGVEYVQLGGFNPVQLNPAAPTNIRSVTIFGGNLYVSSQSSPYSGLNMVGTGLPTTAPQTIMLLPGFPGASNGSSPYGFYFADLSPAVSGVDVVYVADDRGATGGIQKWSLVGGTWVLNGTIASSATATVRGIDGTVSGTTVSLVATSPTGLYVLSDNAGYNAAPSTTTLPTALITPAANTVFRGIAFAPVVPAPTITGISPGSGLVGSTVTVTGTNFTGATALTLNGVAITGFTVVDASTITFVVPTGATSGTVSVTTGGGTATSTGSFTVIVPNPAPTISSLAPNTAVAGAAGFPLTVTGTGFVSSSVITFNGTALPTTFVSATQLTATVPAAAVATAGSYNVTVTSPAPGGGTSAAATFTVTVPAPTIAGFTPATGGPGTSITITGTNLTGATTVRIGSFNVPNFMVVNSTTITLVLPAGTGSVNGFLTVITPGGTAISASTFNLVSAVLAASALPGLVVFPNPATDRLTIDLPTPAPATVALRDLTGRVVLAPAALAANHQLLLPASLARGVYLLEVKQGSTVAIRRIEKQ